MVATTCANVPGPLDSRRFDGQILDMEPADGAPVEGTAEPALKLRIPEPSRGWDPAERVRRHLNTSVEMRKPELDEKVERIALMRKGLVQVLGEDDKAHGPWAPELTTEQMLAGLHDMMLVQVDGCPAAAGASPGKDLVLHAVPRRGGDRLRATAGAPPGRHALPDVPPAGSARGRRLSARRHDEPGPVEHARPVARAPAADHVLVAAPTGSSRSRATSPRSTSRRSVGRWRRRCAATRRSRRRGSARGRRPSPTSTPRSCSPRRTRRR